MSALEMCRQKNRIGEVSDLFLVLTCCVYHMQSESIRTWGNFCPHLMVHLQVDMSQTKDTHTSMTENIVSQQRSMYYLFSHPRKMYTSRNLGIYTPLD